MKNFSEKIFYLIQIVFLSAIVWSCNIINPAEPVPAYLEIESVSLQTKPGTGSSSHKITDAWLIVNNETIGVFEIPKRIPLLGSGSRKIIVGAGVLKDGSSEFRVIYPFYYPDTLTLNLQPKEIYKINPVFHYRDSIKFLFIEDFETAESIFTKMSGDTNMIKTGAVSELFEGTMSGKIHVDTAHPAYEGTTLIYYPLPNNEPVYIEMNYKCDIAFKVGINLINSSGDNPFYNWVVNPKQGWNKIYLNLTDAVQVFGAGNYKILISVENPTSSGEGNVYLDNIKLLTF